MPKSKNSSTFQRLLSASRVTSTHQLRTPWRTRTKRVSIKLTPAEKAEKKARRQSEKTHYQEALQAAHAELWRIAEGLRNEFQKHSTQYYMEEITQISRLQKKQKIAGAWNAFVSKEVKRMNQGAFVVDVDNSPLIMGTFRSSRRCSQTESK